MLTGLGNSEAAGPFSGNGFMWEASTRQLQIVKPACCISTKTAMSANIPSEVAVPQTECASTKTRSNHDQENRLRQ